MKQSDGFDVSGFASDDIQMGVSFGTNGRGTIKVKNTTYAVGLYWEGVEAGSNVAAQARERADNADFFCVFAVPNKTQIGYGNRSQDHKGNMPALAAHIAAGRSTRFLAAFQVEDGYYILGVREDGINPLLERFIASREEAIELYQDAKSEDWDEMLAPDSFGFQDTTEEHIENCLRGRPPVRLKDVKRSKSYAKYLGVAILVVVGIFGFQWYEKIQADAELQAKIQADFEAAANRVLPNQQPKIEIPPVPWENKVLGSQFLKKCVDDVMQFPLDVPGWTVTGFICENASSPTAAATLTRAPLGQGGGPVTWIAPFVETKSYKPSIGYSSTGSANLVSAQWGLFNGANLPKVPLDQVTIPVNQVRTKLLQIMEARFTPVTLSATDMGQFYRSLDFSFETKLNPLGYLDVISAVPGAIIEGVDYSLENNIWKIRGKSYEQLPLPTQVQN